MALPEMPTALLMDLRERLMYTFHERFGLRLLFFAPFLAAFGADADFLAISLSCLLDCFLFVYREGSRE